MRFTMDSAAWLDRILGAAAEATEWELIDQEEVCFTPSNVPAEVIHRCLRDGVAEHAVREEFGVMAESSVLVPIDETVAVEAARATAQLRRRAGGQGASLPGLGDGLVLATARLTDSKVLTRDSHFRGSAEALWLADGPAPKGVWVSRRLAVPPALR